VLILLLEDRYVRDRPVGDLRRPVHFAVTWNQLRRLEPCCGSPDAPAFMRWFRASGRYLGFIVCPARGLPPGRRTEAEAVLDSLRVVA